ncbi:vacuolar protein sorting/targeting protein PEP1 [Microbotryomycetes sp. JL221]|nr:vacuolar protein sorting/targeting protein PEP1 [Microbotryomycetes sp. JL221]
MSRNRTRPRWSFILTTWTMWMMTIAVTSTFAAASIKPRVEQTLFDNLPARIFYFDDSSVVMYHDQIDRNVYRSPDEGKTWAVIKGVPSNQAVVIIDHPHDPRSAFVLTSGTTHYRSMNRGETWQSFTTPLAPSLSANTLSFHANKPEWIIFTGQKCLDLGGWKGRACHDETFYTKDAFASAPKPLMSFTSRCLFAHDKKQFLKSVQDELIYCVAYEPPSTSLTDKLNNYISSTRSIMESRLYSSIDFFDKDKTFVDLGIGKQAKGVVGIGGVQKFIVTALKPTSATMNSDSDSTNGGSGNGEMVLYVTEDGQTWTRAMFPHGHGLKENAYTIVESTQHSILVDVNSSPTSTFGTLFTSNSNGTMFVRSLEHTNRNNLGIVDFEKLENVQGIAIVNTVSNSDDVEAGAEKALKTKITFDDGGRWNFIKAPNVDNEGKRIKCDTNDLESCSLHLHSVTQPHNYGKVFSSTAPGLVMGVGSIGSRLLPYDECDTFLSIDAGLTWSMVEDGAHKYEFGDQGSVIVMVEDEEATDELKYSFDFGKTWHEVDLGVKIRARLLTTVPDSTSLSFVLLGTLTRHSSQRGDAGERHVIVHIDFESLQKRKCSSKDFEKWYARTLGREPDCLMGHKQWFMRRKPEVDCVIGEKFKDPVGVEENCPCEDEDYECDYNFAPDNNDPTVCIPIGPERIPPGQCIKPTDKFKGSSGYRLIPGNTCNIQKGINKDKKIDKPCSAGDSTPGLVTHQTFQFPGFVLDQSYFKDSHTLLAFTSHNRVWQSSNEGFSWNLVAQDSKIIAMTMHAYDKDRAYLITDSRTVHYSTDKGSSWNTFKAPEDPNSLGIPLLDFHPLHADWLIWTGQKDCIETDSAKCRAVAHYSKDNGRNWYKIDEYVRVCSWGRDKKLKIDEKIIFCESYKNKSGSQRSVLSNSNPLQLISGHYFYSQKKVLFDSIVGFATFEEYMVVAEMYEGTRAIGLKVSLDGKTFALARFPPNMHIENQAYTVLESTTDSIFLHVTTNSAEGAEWGQLFKSNSNGTYYAPSLDYVNRNGRGFVDFEKMIGLDGIAVVNIVSNPEEAALSGNKKLQSRITHNDGGRWKSIVPPVNDALGQTYDCTSAKCSLHLHGYTERKDPRATFSSPSATGLMLAVGNVGESLARYTDSDTFLTRDGGFTWQEVHKDAHMWEYGDQGSILVLVNDEEPTDHVTFTLNEGKTWQDYNFGERIRVRSIVTVPTDTSRKFVLFGVYPDKPEASVAVHLDFSSITNVKCKLDISNPNDDDFELWSPSENREEPCLFGKQVLYYRRVQDRNCYIGERLPEFHKIVKHCACTEDDFECEFNYKRNARGECVLVDGAQPLASDQTCRWNQEFWYERTNYRKVPHSECQGGLQLDKGFSHTCPGHETKSLLFWLSLLIVPILFVGLGWVWYQRRKNGMGVGHLGRIRLPEPGDGSRNQLVEFMLSVPWFIIGVTGVIVAKVRDLEIPYVSNLMRNRNRTGYRSLRLDEDAEMLADYDDEDED